MNKISYYLYYSIYEKNRLLVAERLSAVRQQKTHFNNSLGDPLISQEILIGRLDKAKFNLNFVWYMGHSVLSIHKLKICVHERLSDALSTYFDLTSLKCFQNRVSILV